MRADYDWLAREVTTLAFCWRLVREDGAMLGLTSHDQDLRIDGLVYRSDPGMAPSAIVSTSGLSADSMDVEGILDSRGISRLDLMYGRWRGARAEIFLHDWSGGAQVPLRLMAGTLGEGWSAEAGSGGRFALELVADAARLAEQEPPRCMPLCRRQLGDPGCGIDLGGRRVETKALAHAGDELLLEAPVEVGADYRHGTLRVMDGQVAGIDVAIADLTGTVLHLEELLPDDVLAGAHVRLTQGCDKRFETCVERFGNGERFGGEPHLPGADMLMRYGGL